MKFREIAARLRTLSHTLPACSHYHGGDRCRCEGLIEVFRDGAFVIRCRAGAEHVRGLAEKYDRGTASLRAWQNLPARNLPGKPSLRRPPNADALLAALADPEPALEVAA